MRKARASRASPPASACSAWAFGAAGLASGDGPLMRACRGSCSARKKNSPAAVCTLLTPPCHRRAMNAGERSPNRSLLRRPSSAWRGICNSWQALSLAASTSPSRLSASRPCQALARYCGRLWKASTRCSGW
ncbi:hypothetical protein WR25_03995 [Diploscapter pachys]|uniref:Uncharacterized protein n=1 Tax=Diploscapter pachys TaxID=2018661 RepID=A0A2A2M579_9BILA|nr:hypothetical protein WR25_03995 [Diploscapter pachys]